MSTARHLLPDDIGARVRDGERVELPDEGAAIVPLADLRLLEEIEDREDADEARRRLADPAEAPVPYDEARTRLGLA